MKKLMLTMAIAGMSTFGAFAGGHHGCKSKKCTCKGSCAKNHCTMSCCTGGKMATKTATMKHGTTATDKTKSAK